MSCSEWTTGHIFRAYDGPGTPLRCKCGEPEPVGEQGTFDLAAGRRARDEAIKRGDDAADPEEWKATADYAIRTVASTMVEFTTDDVWRLLDEWEIPRPEEPRWMGGRMTAAKAAGIISPTGRYGQTSQVQGHAHPAGVWRSKIYGREETG